MAMFVKARALASQYDIKTEHDPKSFRESFGKLPQDVIYDPPKSKIEEEEEGDELPSTPDKYNTPVKKQIKKKITVRWDRSEIKMMKIKLKSLSKDLTSTDHINLDWVQNQLIKQALLCSKCNVKMKVKKWEKFDPFQYCIYRHDNSKPYLPSNCTIVCFHCKC
jgi:hypothetical protein